MEHQFYPEDIMDFDYDSKMREMFIEVTLKCNKCGVEAYFTGELIKKPK